MFSILLLVALGLPLALSAQYVTPYNPLGSFRNWSVKGKALPFVLGDEGGISFLLGVEYGFARNQSVGVDGFLELISKSDDNATDTAGVTHSVARYFHGRERALFLNYRYYFNYKKLRGKKRIVPYALVFLRYGKIDQHYDPLYTLTSYLNNYETHYSGGLMAGSMIQLSRTGRLAVDINTGIFLKQKDISTVWVKNHQQFILSGKHFGPGFRFAANLVYWFKQ